ncbi:hypothetical protein NP568_24680, partial [Vibrio parahaemolyticus]|nr:hypothetical protein [Vibrio parahaemolyticus]
TSKVTFRTNWSSVTSIPSMGARHLLLRRVPVLEPKTGEVMGYSYTAVVLDNNFSVREKLKNEGHVDNVVRVATDLPVASS